MESVNICICGGGSLGHVVAGFIASQGVRVSVLTTKPLEWRNELVVTDLYGSRFVGALDLISSDPKIVIPQADLILFCLPGNALECVIGSVTPFVKPGASIGSVVGSNGFFWIAKKFLPLNPIFAFQRVPFISRTIKYGETAFLKGYKKELKIGASKETDILKLCSLFESLFHVPVKPLNTYLEAALTNSNPILHPCRLYSLLSKKNIFSEEPFFYESWDNDSSDVLIECDNEFQKVVSELDLNTHELPSILAHYESCDSSSLTKKIRSIEAFKGIKLQMKSQGGGFVPNYEDRYFTEDVPYGLITIKSIAEIVNVKTPNIDKILEWAQCKMNKSYIKEGRLIGEDLSKSSYLMNFGIDSINKLYCL